MDPDIIRKFIADQGYRTLIQLREQFPDVEMLGINLTYLVEKNKIWKVSFKCRDGSCEYIYYIPCSIG